MKLILCGVFYFFSVLYIHSQEDTLTDNNINKKIEPIIAGGASDIVEQNRCSAFKRFLKNAPYAQNENNRNDAILALRAVINIAALRDIFGRNLEDNYMFTLKRLLRSEIENQNIAAGETQGLEDLIVRITSGGIHRQVFLFLFQMV